MFKKIILSLLVSILLLSGVSVVNAKEYRCGEVWSKYNWKQSITRDEIKVCRSQMVKFYKMELYLEYQARRDIKNYCYDKWVETYNNRRITSRIEDKVCGKSFAKYNKNVLKWKSTLVNY